MRFADRTLLKRRVPQARSAIVWALAVFLAIQLGLNLLVEADNPTIYDDEFSVRFPALQTLMAEAPGQPLLLLIGSSRSGMAYLPEVLPPLQTPAGERPILYNFSHQGAGPILNAMMLRRLLRRGIRPRWLVLEVMPPCLNHEYHSVATTCAELRELPSVCRYFSPVRAGALVLRSRLFPCYRQRGFLCGSYLPLLAAKTVAEKLAYIDLLPQGGDGGWQLQDQLDKQEIARRIRITRAGYRPRLQDFQIKPETDRALQETLQLCRENDIETVLLLMPEGSEFQSWYAPWALPQIDAYCRGLSRDFGVPLVDARHWLPDNLFTDSHHPLRPGAMLFTERLAREVLGPLVQGRLRLSRENAP